MAIGRDLSVTSRCHSTFLSGSDTRMWCLAGREGKQADGEPSSKARVWTLLEKAGEHFAETENNFSNTKGGIRERARGPSNETGSCGRAISLHQSLSTSRGPGFCSREGRVHRQVFVCLWEGEANPLQLWRLMAGF